MIKLVIDKDIPFIEGVFERFASVKYIKGASIDPEAVADADGLIIRTRTKCNSALLSGSRVRFIATATIGTDHIDLDFCANNGIKVESAAGCNSSGVMQYFYTALFALANSGKISLHYGENSNAQDKRTVLGVIGAGNVGGKIAALGESLGFKVLRNDPPKEFRQTMDFNYGKIHVPDFVNYYSLDYLLEHSDIVTIHTPLLDTTRGMANKEFFAKMKPGALFFNTSRGEAVDENALMEAREKLSALVLDVWNGEPDINKDLVPLCDIATPHIAGYSIDGKANGTIAVVNAAADFFGFDELKGYRIPEQLYKDERVKLDLYGNGVEENWRELSEIFPIYELDSALRENLSEFESIRSNYKLRREFYVETK